MKNQDLPTTDVPYYDHATFDGMIAGLAQVQDRLFQAICDRRDQLDAAALARLLTLHGQNATRLGRLLRDRPTLAPYVSPELDAFFKEAWVILKTRYPETVQDLPDDYPVSDDPATPTITIDDLIADLAYAQAWLFDYLHRSWDDPDRGPPLSLCQVYAQNTSRLQRLFRYRCDIHGPPPDPLQEALDWARDRLGQEWGIEL
jgi:hypothetical protein